MDGLWKQVATCWCFYYPFTSWETIAATQWSGYENLHGQVTIKANESTASLLIEKEQLTRHVEMTGSSQIASKEQINANRIALLIMSVIRNRLIIYDQHKRPSSEIDAIDQIVFRLKEVQSGDVVLNTTRRMCSVALLDARVTI